MNVSNLHSSSSTKRYGSVQNSNNSSSKLEVSLNYHSTYHSSNPQYNFKQPDSKVPLFTNQGAMEMCAGATALCAIDYMSRIPQVGIERIREEHINALELQLNPWEHIKAAIMPCCGRSYKVKRPQFFARSNNMFRLQMTPQQMKLTYKRIGFKHCLHNEISDTVEDILRVIHENELELLVVDVGVYRHSMLLTIVAEKDSYAIYPYEPKEEPYELLKIPKEALNDKLVFNNLFTSEAIPHGNIPKFFSWECMVLKDTEVDVPWNPSRFPLVSSFRTMQDQKKYMFVLFNHIIDSGDGDVARFALKTLKENPELAKEIDFNYAGERSEQTKKENWGVYYLIEAIKLKHVDVVKVLVEEGNVPVNCRGAFSANHAGKDFTLTNRQLSTPLKQAIRVNSIEIVNILLNNGANPLFPNGKEEKTALKYAIFYENQDIVNTLNSTIKITDIKQ